MDPIQNFNSILQTFKIKAACVGHERKDNYFYFDLRLNANARVKDIKKYSDEISLALKTPSKATVKVLHQEGVVRLEFITPCSSPLKLLDIFTNKGVPRAQLPCLLGKTLDGTPMWMDLAENPHMIVAGTTGSGKSTLLHNLIANLLNYNDVEISLIDLKGIEFAPYEKHLRNTSVLYTYRDALAKVQEQIHVMEARYALMRKEGFKPAHFQSNILIIDEFSALIMQDKDGKFFQALCTLAQKCRAAKIYIVLATQRPSADIINGAIKANFPARIACRVSSHVDSKVILDASGAENLVGRGDALVRDDRHYLERFQIAYTDADEVCSVYGV